MYAVTEGHVMPGISANIEAVRISKRVLVPVCRRIGYDDPLARPDQLATYLDVFRRRVALEDVEETQNLFDCPVHEPRIIAERFDLVGMIEHQQDAQRGCVRGRLMTGHKKLPRDANHLRVCQLTGAHIAPHKPTQ